MCVDGRSLNLAVEWPSCLTEFQSLFCTLSNTHGNMDMDGTTVSSLSSPGNKSTSTMALTIA